MKQLPHEAGYTYITVLIVVFALALAAQVTWIPASTERARETEAELLFRGLAYRDAVRSHWEWGGQNRYPPTLDALLEDPRQMGLRHIRRLYESPVCEGRWRQLSAPGGGIAGVAPDCDAAPFKQSGFPSALDGLEAAGSYAEWEFRFDPPTQQ